jgi:hypothetical protein
MASSCQPRHEPEDQVELRRRIKEDKLAEAQRLNRLLGDDYPELQKRLFLALENERNPLEERNVIEIVYRLGLGSLSHLSEIRHRERLRQLQKRLNDRLAKRVSPQRIFRPGRGWLFLHDLKNPSALVEATRRCNKNRLTPEVRNELIRFLKQEGGNEDIERILHADVYPKGRATVEECMTLIQQFLKKGPRNSGGLTKHCSELDCCDKTIRTARRRLSVKASRKGFGAQGHWMVSLPPHITDNGKRAPLSET